MRRSSSHFVEIYPVAGSNEPAFTKETDAQMLPVEFDDKPFADFARPSHVPLPHSTSPRPSEADADRSAQQSKRILQRMASTDGRAAPPQKDRSGPTARSTTGCPIEPMRWTTSVGATRSVMFWGGLDETGSGDAPKFHCPGESAPSWDPTFDARPEAAYYVRVLEGRSCRWSHRECLGLAVDERPDPCESPGIPKLIQERAWTSPIWLIPDSGAQEETGSEV